MSDLISREAVKKAIRNYFIGKTENHIYEVDAVDCNAEICNEVLDSIPTAYDVDGVLEQLDDAYNNGILGDYHNIVKGAVKDELH